MALDVARGLMLVVSTIVDTWVMMPAWFDHAPWAGVHPIDLVFPTFVTLTGTGLAMAYARRVRWRRELRRAAVLVIVGLAYNALVQYLDKGALDPSTFRLTGVLQLYGAVVLAMALIGRWVRRWWHWGVALAGLAALQWGLLASWQTGCPSGRLETDCNPSGVIDLAVFGVHMYASGRNGHDPEGLVVLLGAVLSACIGATAGRLVLEHHRGMSTRVFLGGAAAVVVAYGGAAVASSWWIDPFKRLWTTPFSFGVSVATIAVVLVMHVLLDARAGSHALVRRVCLPLVALGRNSLLVYFGGHALTHVLTARGPTGLVPNEGQSWAGLNAAALADAVGMPSTPWPYCAAAVLAWTSVAILLHRRGVYIKA